MIRIYLERKIFGSFVLALLLMGTVALVSYRSTLHLIDTANASRRSQEILSLLSRILSTTTDAESGQRGFVVTGEDVFLEPYHLAVARIDDLFHQLRQSTADKPELQDSVAALKPLIQARLNWSAGVIALRQSAGFEAASQETATRGGKEIQDAIRRLIAGMEHVENDALKRGEEETRAEARFTLSVIGVSGLLAILFVGAAVVVIHRDLLGRRRAEFLLQEAHDTLERQVEARTWELSQANADLASEISERARIEEELRESRDFAGALLDSLPGVFYLYDEEFRFIRWNRNFETVTGYTGHEIAAMSPLDFFNGSDKKLVAERIGNVFTEGSSNVEADFVARDGTRTPYYFTGLLIRFRDKASLLGIGIDISVRKHYESQLQHLVEVIQRLAAARDATAIQDAVRSAARHLARADGATFILRDGDQCYYADEEAIDPLWKGKRFPLKACISGWVMLNRQAVTIEDIYSDPRVPAEAYRSTFVKSLAVVPIGVDAPLGAIGNYWAKPYVPTSQELQLLQTLADAAFIALENLRAYQDLEQRVEQRTRELALAKEHAEAADRLKSAFLATMSHELRTPLNSIIGFTGIILQSLAGPLNAEQTKQLGMVRSSARHLLALINDVLDISKIEAGQLEVASEPFDLQASLEKAVSTVEPLAKEKGLTMKVQLSPDLGTVVSDQRRVEQVVINLLNNAIKFASQGSVTLTAEPVSGLAAKSEAISASRPRPAIRIEVADTGMGIKPEDLETLFKPFRQIDTGLARQHEGTGLGLAICRRLAGLLGAEIRAESEWGKGSVFTFILPRQGAST